jgi:hypothetical protein
VIAAAGLTCLAALTAACSGSSTPAAAPTATVTRTVTQTAPASDGSTGRASAPTVSNGPQPCATSALKATIGPGNGAAGSSFFPIAFTNTSGTTCTLYGYPGVSFVTAAGGSQIGAAATRSSSITPALVSLAPGATAHAMLQVVNANNYPPSRCTVVHTHWLRVYPPDQFTPLYISFSSQTCGGGASATGILSVQTVQPGANGQ